MNASPPLPTPEGVQTAEQLLERLAELRAWAGQPSLRTLRRLAGTTTSPSGDVVDALPASTTSYVLNGRGLPRPPRLEFVEAFVTACLLACDHPKQEIPAIVERWRACWRALALAQEGAATSEGAVPRAAPAPASPGMTASGTAVPAPLGASGPGPAPDVAPTIPASTPAAAVTFAEGPPRPGHVAPGVAPSAAPGPPVLAPPDDAEPAARPQTPPGHGRRTRWRGDRRVPLTAAVGLAVAAALVGVAGTLLVVGNGEQPAGPSPGLEVAASPGLDPAGPAGPMRVVKRGVVTGMRDVEGFDADRGMVLRQNSRGIDVSGWSSGNHLVAKSQAVVMPLRETGAEDHRRCTRRPAAAKTQQIKGLHAWPPGHAICIWTAEGNLALLTLERTPSPADPVLAFRYVVWRPGD
jgi:hypothetical protein